MRSPALPFLLAASLAAGAGCQRPPSDASEGENGAASSSTAEDPSNPAVKEDPAKVLDRDLSRILASNEVPGKKLVTLKSFLKNVKIAQTSGGRSLPVVARTEREIKQIEKSFEEEAGGEFAKLLEKVKPLMERDAPDFDAASALVGDFPADRYKESSIAAKLEELKARINLCQRADMEYEFRKGKLGQDPIKNIALLEGFDPAYAGTPSFAQVQKLIKENYKLYVDKREASASFESKAKWVDIDVKGYRPVWPDSLDCIDLKEGLLVLGPNKEEYLKSDPQASLAGSCIRFGDDEWIDVEIRFEAQVTDGANVFFGARGHFISETEQVYNFSWKDLGGLELDGKEWNELVVRIEGSLMEITATGKKSVQTDKVRLLPGPFGIRVSGEKAAIKLRKMQVWVMKKEAPPEGENPVDEKGKKKGAPRKKSGD